MGFYRGPRVIQDGLVLALDAGSTRSYPGTGTTWYDLSGNGNDATVESSVSFSSTYRGGLTTLNDLNNANQSINGSFSLSSEYYTWEIWFTNNGSQGVDASAFGVKDSGGISSNGFRAQPSIQTWIDGSLDVSTTALATSSPTQVIQRRSGITFNGFVNSALSDTDTGDSDYGTYTSYSMNDRGFTSSNNGWNGTYYIVRMYNRALSDAEIKQNFNAQKGRFGL
jgi:hypothetical protein